jgi:PBP1b-binding outer membrane lipoprotein LpoB
MHDWHYYKIIKKIKKTITANSKMLKKLSKSRKKKPVNKPTISQSKPSK